MDDQIDLLQIRIEKAKRELPEATLNAITAVDWRTPILGMRQSKGYTFEQLGDLELETELLLCGLVSPEDYQKELEKRMNISKAQASALVNEMNDLVFKKIRAELVKSADRKNIFAEKSTDEKNDSDVFSSAGIEIIRDQPTTPPVRQAQTERPSSSAPSHSAPKQELHPILAQKLSGSVKNEVVETEHTLDNITKINTSSSVNEKPKIPNVDPYREIPE